MLINFKMIIGLVLSLVYVCMSKETNYLFYSYMREGETIIVSGNTQLNPVNVPNWTAQVYYNASQNQSGWDLLEINTNPSMADEIQAYQAGYIEGYITRQQIWNYYYNSIEEMTSNKSNKANDILKEYFEINKNYIIEMTSKNLNDPFWYQVHLMYQQLQGMFDGYNKATSDEKIKDQTLSDDNFMYLHFMEELPDIINAYVIQHPNFTHSNSSSGHNKTSNVDEHHLHGHIRDFGSHCSALIKVVPGNSDVFIGHDTWSGFSTMNRILKRYKLPFRVSQNSSELIPGMSTAFSSYPGILASVDDFYVMGSGIVTLETTNEVYNKELYKKDVHPKKTVLEEVRNVVANRLASDGKSWMDYFRRENSGTYNNQWMIIDLNNFKPGFDPAEGFLSVLEQAPGIVEGHDQTDHLLKYGYWASYNIPFYRKMYNVTENSEAAKNNSWYSYSECPRAKMFKKLQSKVINMDSMIWMMRYNDYMNDSYSICEKCTPKPNACNAIASRCDLNPMNGNYSALPPVGPALFGAIDAKIISYSLFSKGEMLAIGGPTTSGVPPFSWSTTKMNTTGVRHMGQPDKWDFPPLITSWLLPYTVKSDENGSGNDNSSTVITATTTTTTTPKSHKSSSIVIQPVSAVIILLIALSIGFKA